MHPECAGKRPTSVTAVSKACQASFLLNAVVEACHRVEPQICLERIPCNVKNPDRIAGNPNGTPLRCSLLCVSFLVAVALGGYSAHRDDRQPTTKKFVTRHPLARFCR